LWLQAEVVVLATDLAEFVGAAIGMQLLFGLPVAASAIVTAAVSLLLLELRRNGRTRPFELMSAAALVMVGTGFGYDILDVGNQSSVGLASGLVPQLNGPGSLVLAMGIVGATVMPHAIYLHSALVQGRGMSTDAAWRQPTLVRRALRLDCALALGAATAINVSMMAFGAGLGVATGGAWAGDLVAAHAELASRFGGAAALAFAIALLSSGVSSAGVGTLAGDVVMHGFLGRRLPVHARRIVTMTPAVLALLLGLPLTSMLIASQVVISLGVPVAMFLLILFCRDRSLMGPLVNDPLTTRVAGAAGAMVAALGCCLPLTFLF
jgi:manganese transport protein